MEVNDGFLITTVSSRDKNKDHGKLILCGGVLVVLLILLIPIMSWYGTTLFLQRNKKIVLPWELTTVIAIPYTHITEIDKLIVPINQYFDATGFVFGQIFFTIILSIIGFGLMSFIYAIM